MNAMSRPEDTEKATAYSSNCGKTEFVKWLGDQLGRKIVTLGASDLKDKFVGETEKRIARAFLSFGYLEKEGKRRFFERFFGEPLTNAEAAELDAIPDLCPGDFRTVRQCLDYLPGGRTNARRLAALHEESARKAALPPGENFDRSARGRIGF